jgi:hypothetical protein
MTAARILADVNRVATTITSTSASTTPITIKAASDQSADLLQFKNSSDVIVGEIDKNGILTTPGSVVQVQTVSLTSSGIMTTPSTFTIATDGTTPMSIAFTPKLSNSLIKVEWMLLGVTNGADPVAWCAPFKDSNSMYTGESTGIVGTFNIGDAWKQTYGTVGDNNLLNTFSGHWFDTNSSLTTRTYSFRVKARSGNFFINRTESNNASQNYSTQGRSRLTITEIAQ